MCWACASRTPSGSATAASTGSDLNGKAAQDAARQVRERLAACAALVAVPTLIAGIYGMNFQYMPELNQTWGYPMAIALMAASAVVPMWYFRKRGWLK